MVRTRSDKMNENRQKKSGDNDVSMTHLEKQQPERRTRR